MIEVAYLLIFKLVLVKSHGSHTKHTDYMVYQNTIVTCIVMLSNIIRIYGLIL